MRRYSSYVLLWMMASGQVLAQVPSAETAREEDDEPNQHDVFAPLGTESDRSRWLLEGAELVLKPRTYYLYRTYDEADTRAGLALGTLTANSTSNPLASANVSVSAVKILSDVDW